MTATITDPAVVRPSALVAARISRSTRLVHIGVTAAPAIIVSTWLAHRSRRPMTMDESFTVLTSGRSWWSLVRGCTTDPGMAVYYFSLKVWTIGAGTSLDHLRWFSLLALAAALLGVATIAVDRRRAGPAMLAGVGLALTPMVREAAFDARAAALGAALAVWLVVLCDRWLGDLAWPRRRVGLLLGWSLATAFVHPSTLFAGLAGAVLVWRFARQEGDRPVRRWATAIVGVIGLGGLVAAGQSGAAETVARPGWRGLADVVAQLPGGRVLTGIALLATVSLLLAGRSFDRERIVRWFAGSSMLWFAACAVALPARSLFIPRYFVAAAFLIVLALMLARLEQWSSPVIMLTVALGVVGGAARLDYDYGTGSPWCSVAERMDAMASPGDRMVFGSSTYASPVLACLGDDGTTLLSSGPTVPALTSTDLRDPRALWMNRVASVDDVLALAPGETAHYVWVPAIDTAVGGAVGELRDAGATCEFESFGAVTLASCTTG